MNQIVHRGRLGVKEAMKQKVFVGQVCGLKCVIKQMKLAACGAYVAEKVLPTIRIPTNESNISSFVNENLNALFVFKKHVVEEAERFQGILLEDNGSFCSSRSAADNRVIKELFYLEKNARKLPLVAPYFFKSN
ncbi:hypothetical protein EDC96DRAFT_608565 [Choanephora cucurbitarum]|nr:hypothetical protein EDC96DRAFT_608565 [Choanephora cucurbitarum]